MKINIKRYYQNKLYRWLLVSSGLFLIGIVLLIITSSTGKEISTTKNLKMEDQTTTFNQMDEIPETEYDLTYEEIIEMKLEDILSQVEGVGQLKVMVTMDNKGEIILNKEYPTSKSYTKEVEEDGSIKEVGEETLDSETVIINNSSGEQAIVVEELYPRVRGVLIIAEGASNTKVKNDLFNATKVLLNVSVNKIEVLTMNNIEESENENE